MPRMLAHVIREMPQKDPTMVTSPDKHVKCQEMRPRKQLLFFLVSQVLCGIQLNQI